MQNAPSSNRIECTSCFDYTKRIEGACFMCNISIDVTFVTFKLAKENVV